MTTNVSERWFFEIPVYRCTLEQYLKEKDEEIQKRHEYLDSFRTSKEPSSSFVYDQVEERIRTGDGGWRYNQVVGWIRLFAMNQQIQGEYYFNELKRFNKDFKNKKVVLQGKAFEIPFLIDQPSEEIFSELQNAFKELGEEKPFKKRFIDLEAFNSIGSHINWCALIRFEDH